MKFFTMQWWNEGQTWEDSKHAFTLYKQHMVSIRHGVPEELLRLYDEITLHDSSVREIRQSSIDQELIIELGGDGEDGCLRDIRLRYLGVSSFRMTVKTEEIHHGPHGFGDLGYDEIDLADPGFFEHRMLFSSGTEITITFRDFELHYQDDIRPFDLADLDSSDEDTQRFAIIGISRKRMLEHTGKLVEILQQEIPEANRRHVVRALGNLCVAESAPHLLRMLEYETGMIAGDVAKSLGQIGVVEAIPILESLTESPILWVAEQACAALKRLVHDDIK